MSQLDAIALSKAVKKRLVDFALNSHFVQDPQLTKACQELWSGAPETGGLLSDLWIEGAFPAEASPESLNEMVKRKLFDAELCDHLDKRGVMPKDRSLYLHQRDAIVKAQATYSDNTKPALIVTAGTGTGKTESFLLPILNDLFTAPATKEAGVKCIILYPMNALVNDQVDRLYDWLQGQRKVTLFHFTSETPEDKARADEEDIPIWDICRMRTRKEARGLETHYGNKVDLSKSSRGPVPDILVTNYSMLEYMLCRPQDAVFFGKALRSLVLDEAHLYTGTLATEITLLLRRLLERCALAPEQILHIATSATVGRGTLGELESFSAQLFTKQQSLIQVIRGQNTRIPLPRAEPPEIVPSYTEIVGYKWLDQPTIELDTQSKPRLVENADLCNVLSKNLPALVSEAKVQKAQPYVKDKPSILLHYALRYSPLLHRIESILWEQKRLPLRDLTKQLWGTTDDEATQATALLLQMGASAREHLSDYPLLPNRIHILARSTDGLVVCLNKDCSGKDDLKLDGLGCISEGLHDHCLYCQSTTLPLYRCDNCGTWVMKGVYNETPTYFKPVPTIGSAGEEVQCTTSNAHLNAKHVAFDITTGRCDQTGIGRLALALITACPHCKTDKPDNWKPFVQSTSLALSILAESVLSELPEYPAPYKQWLPGRGRRMLAFSDSRQAAARLGPNLTRQHEIQLVRAALVQCLRGAPIVDGAVIQDLQDEIADLERQLGRDNLTDAQRQRKSQQLADKRQEHQQAQIGGKMDKWADALKEIDTIEQLLNVETAPDHEAARWIVNAQEEWNKNTQQVYKQLKFLLAREFARPTQRQTSLETLGLAEVTYPGLDTLAIPDRLLGELPTATARSQLRGCWSAFLAALCDTLRTDGAITLGSEDEDKAYQFSHFLGHWCAEEAEEEEPGTRLLRFVGATNKHRRRKFAAAVLHKCGIGESDLDYYAEFLLKEAFHQLQTQAGKAITWLETEQRQSASGAWAIRLKFLELCLRYPTTFYRCPTTGYIWVREVLGCAPETGCVNLEQVSEGILDQDPRIMRQRREFISSPVFRMGLWAEEHSAQLSPKENRRLQDLFKAGVRNMLSSTTTMELGIDIGGLNAVLMSNVPPGKANYLQRAGRAGRRADGSSIVMTFCRPQPFDREVFLHFGEYLERPLRSPKVFLERKRIVSRHSHAFLLGEFFRSIFLEGTQGAMNAFGRMGQFCGMALPSTWEKGSNKPVLQPYIPDWKPPTRVVWWKPGNHKRSAEGRFLDYLRWIRDEGESSVRPAMERILRDTGIYLDDWAGFLNDIIKHFAAAVRNWREEFDKLLQAWHETSSASNARGRANAIRYQMSALHDLTVIEALADQQFLPRYGFPIGTQRLRVIAPDKRHPGNYHEEDQYRLERRGLIAIGEYVPGSQLLVGGRLVTAHGLLKHWTGANVDNYIGLRGQYTRCLHDHLYYVIAGELGHCPICHAKPRSAPQNFLLPMHGFSSAAWDPPRISTDVDRIGRTEKATIAFAQRQGTDIHEQKDFGGIAELRIFYREDGELLVYNEGDYGKGFAICLKCGYGESEKEIGEGNAKLPSHFKRHAPLLSDKVHTSCWGNDEETPQAFRNHVLAARETTNALMLDFSFCLGDYADNHALLWTLAQALRISGAKLLELDSRELETLVIPAGDLGSGLGAVLYDNVPGGAGHVAELLDLGREWLLAAYETMFVNSKHHEICETACLDCLLTFDAQDLMQHGLLNRGLAIQILDALLKGKAFPQTERGILAEGVCEPPRSPKDRIQDARNKRRTNR